MILHSWCPAERSGPPGRTHQGRSKGNDAAGLLHVLVVLLAVLLPWSFGAGEAVAGGAADSGKPAADDTLYVTLRASLDSPLFSEFPVATVNDESITLDELKGSLSLSHEVMAAGEGAAPGTIDFSVFLDRLITVRLFIQEARHMGIADLPEIKGSLERFSELLLKQQYERHVVKDLKADDATVEKRYREAVKEWQIRSVMFRKEEEAAKMEAAVKGGASFEAAADEALRAGTVAGSSDSSFVRANVLHPQVAAALSAMKIGSMSPVIPLGTGMRRAFSLVKLEDVRYPDDPEERERVRVKVLAEARQKAVKQRRDELAKKLVRIDTKVLNGLDYEAKKPGLGQLEQDRRVVAAIKGGEPIRVSDLTAMLKKKFFHGMGQAAQSKKINKEKKAMLDDLIENRLFLQEGRREGLDKTPEYRMQVREFETTGLFGAFVTKVIQPEVQVPKEEQEAYYRDHGREFLAPDSMRLVSLAFGTEREAASALAKLQKGTDLAWMQQHAEGRLPEDTAELVKLNGDLTLLANLPPDIAGPLADARAGEYRLGKDRQGRFYVIAVTDVVTGSPLPFDTVGQAIEKRLYGEKLNKAVEAWSERLRKASDITINLVNAKH